MKRNVNKPFERKITLYVLLGTFFFSLITGFVIYEMVYQSQLNQSRQHQKDLVYTNAIQASVGLFANNKTILNDVANGLLSSQLIEGVEISDNDQVIIARQENTEDFMSSDSYPLYSPVNSKEQIGVIDIALNEESITNEAQEKALLFSFIAIAQTFVMVIIVILIHRYQLARPLTMLAKNITQITPGSDQRLITKKQNSGDELGVLTECANDFLAATEEALNNERSIRLELEKIQEQYKRILDTSRISFFVLNQREELVNYNNAMEMLVEKTLLKSIDDIKDVFSDKFFSFPDEFWKMTLSAIKSRNTVSGKLQLATYNNKDLWVQCIISVVYKYDGELELVEGVMFDVTEQLQELEHSRELAQIDNLTKLKNRHGFDIAFDRLLKRAKEDNQNLVVFLLDLDEFKPINDNYGHAEGDFVLIEIASRISAALHRTSDLSARFGGDEFAIVFPFPDDDFESFSELLAKRLIETISKPILLRKSQESVSVTVSIGIASFPDAGTVQEEIMEAADKAMYRAKKQGKSNYSFYS